MSSNNNLSVRVEGLSKRYLIPHRQELTSRKDKLAAHMREFFPFMGSDERDFFWALRDISFEVKPGQILGIVGSNGSGKSTLLKLLTGVTQPTSGRALIRGKVGSLLEVGTGFHPDLTGRENVFMSGVLLGLSKKEIASKFDELVDFSGIEKFIDVPAKRYSSGMYVRLAYSVASMLRADVLILDEVMSVGDAAFRAKSQKNIDKISQDGRTVIVVSHNIPAIRRMCNRGIFLDQGKLILDDSMETIATEYMRRTHALSDQDGTRNEPRIDISEFSGLHGPREHKILRWIESSSTEQGPTVHFGTGQGIHIKIGLDLSFSPPVSRYYFAIFFINVDGERVMLAHSLHNPNCMDIDGNGIVECHINDNRLVDGRYILMLDVGIAGPQNQSLDCVPNAQEISVVLGNYLGAQGLRPNQGYLAQKSNWSFSSEQNI